MPRPLLTDGKQDRDWKRRTLPDGSFQMRRRLHSVPAAFWHTYSWLYGNRARWWGIKSVLSIVLKDTRWHTVYHPSWGDPLKEIARVAKTLENIAARIEEHGDTEGNKGYR